MLNQARNVEPAVIKIKKQSKNSQLLHNNIVVTLIGYRSQGVAVFCRVTDFLDNKTSRCVFVLSQSGSGPEVI